MHDPDDHASLTQRFVHHSLPCHVFVNTQIIRLRARRERYSLSRGWSRLCIHAASIATGNCTPAFDAARSDAARAKTPGSEAVATDRTATEQMEETAFGHRHAGAIASVGYNRSRTFLTASG